ncbi:hypothetical protein M758_2G245000 [Ceratodon purpureus]|uniref:Protein-tyrosine sulfotransferase n=1 Tax=Ceratodon purpureus TaxID=3225 RepID=A0A8T0J1L4_CERPU|nr:hypothetical protein KC19_2G292000 [Ceratodon purpureus]KAG0628033.1 hypothetical protein M758_2G245000 [Ceratodon purpureus]
MPSSTRGHVLAPPFLLLSCLFLACHHTQLVAASTASSYDRRSCEAAVLEWSAKEKLALNNQLHPVQHEGVKILDLLFFLHIPRTGGRTYHQCFLKNLYLPKDRCPRSYDKLRLDLSQPSCKLLSSHDDMSILNKIPSRTSVVTNMRNPVDRVLSTYEFSVEVAARFLRLKSINSSRSPLPRANSPSELVSTLTIWPWKYLVPFMQHDIFARRDARREGKVDWPPSSNTTYDAPTITMPLTEFIHHPVAHELVHNGATFQVAGLTNNSYEEGSVVIRKCISQYPKLGYQVLDVAKRRLDSMLFVGLTEKHQESATTFFSLVGDQVQVQSEALKGILDPNTSVPVQEKNPPNLLLAAYKSCLTSLRSSHAVRRASTLQLISPVRYSQEERDLIPSSVVDKIIYLNKLDMELHEYAKFLYAKQQKRFEASTSPQIKEGQIVVLSMFLVLCITLSVLLLGFALMLRVRNRVGNDWVPFWLRRLAFMQAHEKL